MDFVHNTFGLTDKHNTTTPDRVQMYSKAYI